MKRRVGCAEEQDEDERTLTRGTLRGGNLRLVQSSDQESSGRGDDLNGSLTILNNKLNSDSQASPVLGDLGNIVGNLLGRLWRVLLPSFCVYIPYREDQP